MKYGKFIRKFCWGKKFSLFICTYNLLIEPPWLPRLLGLFIEIAVFVSSKAV